MGIGASIFLIALGAILAFAVSVTVNGIDLVTIGAILMIVGGIGLLWSLIVVGTARARRVGPTVVDDPVPPRRTVVRDY
jgi:hypothetical protein